MTHAARDETEKLREEARTARDVLVRTHVAGPGEAHLAAVARRVGDALAGAEPPGERARRADEFAGVVRGERFWPSVPILSNAGRPEGQLAACYVLEPEDSLDSIYDTLRRAALIQQGSGGVGLDLSRLRPRGARIERSGGASPGPVAFAELAAHSARVNALAGRREGAHLVVLADDHPDVLAFVEAARRVTALHGAGLALAVSDALLEAARRGEDYPLRDPRDGRAGRVPARALLDAIARAIRDTGNPTLLFLDAIAAGNPVPGLGALRASNPCGEQPLLPGESCVLGSLCLPAFADAEGRVDLDALAVCVHTAVRMLDDVVEVGVYPDEGCRSASRRTRKIGLGVMGFADLLLLRGERYGSPASKRTASMLLERIAREARAASEALAGERGPHPAQLAGLASGPARRNASLLAVAPTGTLRLLAGCSGGLEPWIDPVVRVEASGRALRWVDRWLLDWLDAHTRDPRAAVDALEAAVPTAELPGLADAERPLLRRAHEVAPEDQVALQACFQAHVDGAISKTVHLPHDVSADDIVRLIQKARDQGCKGLALWRVGDAPAPACIHCGN